MKDERAIELLPWLLNRSLEAAEERELRERLASSESLRRELAETLAAARLLGAPPAIDTVLDYARGRLEEGRETFESLLEAAPEHAEEVRLARRSWALLDGRMRLVDPRRGAPVPAWWRSAAVAAALAAVVGFGGWLETARRAGFPAAPATPAEARIAELEARVESLAGPRVNVSVHDLSPTSFVQRGGGEGNVLSLGETGEWLSLILGSDSDLDYESYEIELLDAAGERVWRGGGLERTPGFGDYTLLLPRSLLEPGEYRLEIFASPAAEPRQPVESYRLTLTP